MQTTRSISCPSPLARIWAKKSRFLMDCVGLSHWSQARAIYSMRAIMSKCTDSLDHWTTRQVARRVVETVVAGLVILMMAACSVGPNYKRPATSTPQSFRGALAPEVAAPAQAESSIGDHRWSTIFQDPVFPHLVPDTHQ